MTRAGWPEAGGMPLSGAQAAWLHAARPARLEAAPGGLCRLCGGPLLLPAEAWRGVGAAATWNDENAAADRSSPLVCAACAWAAEARFGQAGETALKAGLAAFADRLEVFARAADWLAAVEAALAEGRPFAAAARTAAGVVKKHFAWLLPVAWPRPGDRAAWVLALPERRAVLLAPARARRLAEEAAGRGPGAAWRLLASGDPEAALAGMLLLERAKGEGGEGGGEGSH